MTTTNWSTGNMTTPISKLQAARTPQFPAVIYNPRLFTSRPFVASRPMKTLRTIRTSNPKYTFRISENP